MKISTLLTMVTLSASCFAAPAHTANESLATGDTDGSAAAALAAKAAPVAPVAPAAPDVAAIDASKTQHWEFIALPKSNHPERGFVAKNEHLQT